MDHDCVIGLLCTSKLCTVKTLEQHIAERKKSNDFLRQCCPGLQLPDRTMAEYADRRRSTDLTHFNFCPMCGEKIDWKMLRKKRDGGACG